MAQNVYSSLCLKFLSIFDDESHFSFLIQKFVIENWGTATAWKVSKYGVISGPYFPVFSPNTGKHGPEITPYLDTFHAVKGFPRPQIEHFQFV